MLYYIVSAFYTKHSRHVHTTNPLLYLVVSYISVAQRFAIQRHNIMANIMHGTSVFNGQILYVIPVPHQQ
jgi:hypothetical protein